MASLRGRGGQGKDFFFSELLPSHSPPMYIASPWWPATETNVNNRTMKVYRWNVTWRDGLLRKIYIDSPLNAKHLQEYQLWWQHEETPRLMALSEGVRYGWPWEGSYQMLRWASCAWRGPRKDGTVKLQNVGWFMVTDPKTGVILGVDEMKTAENSDIALKMVEKLRPLYQYVNCTIYDRTCTFLKKAKQRKSLNKIRF